MYCLLHTACGGEQWEDHDLGVRDTKPWLKALFWLFIAGVLEKLLSHSET